LPKVFMQDETTLQSKVPPAQEGKSLLDYISERFRYQGRETWKKLIIDGKVTLNEKSASPDQPLKSKDIIAYSVVLNEPPVDRNIRIIHNEESFLVAYKPGNLPSHADGNFIKNTFIYILSGLLKEQGFNGSLNLVHRLDRETSGLMVVSKNKTAHQKLIQQFETGLVAKEYLAITRGLIPEDQFEVSGAIGRDTDSQVSVRQKVVSDDIPFAKKSSTRFEVVSRLSNSTLVRCLPKTGRTNQIRIHLASIGHSLVGDKLYGRSDDEFLAFVHHVKSGGDAAWTGHIETPRQMLHASQLSFLHPETAQKVTFTVELPEDFKNYLERD
ncbi:MAG TPA: RluA family pseudouridine synthase, partial [bacterium]|nr:RluA family pseudouridine synthase [bacterium]